MYENDQNSVNGELKQPKGFEQNENDEFAPAGEDSKNEFTAAESEPNGEPAGGSEYEWNHYEHHFHNYKHLRRENRQAR